MKMKIQAVEIYSHLIMKKYAALISTIIDPRYGLNSMFCIG